MQSDVTDPVKDQTAVELAAVELKGSVFTLPVLQIRSCSIASIERELINRLSPALKFFQNAPLVIDLERIANTENVLDFNALMQMLNRQALITVGVRNGSAQQNALAISSGLAILRGGATQALETFVSESNEKTAPVKAATAASQAPIEQENTAPVQIQRVSIPTKIIKHPVRSGQQIYAKGGDLIVMASVNPGAEIIADGNIHVYSSMNGRALAGVMGDTNARIFCQSMQAELIAIAGNFRVFEETPPDEIRGKAVQTYLKDEHLIISPIA